MAISRVRRVHGGVAVTLKYDELHDFYVTTEEGNGQFVVVSNALWIV